MSAVMGMLKSGDTILIPTDLYGGTYRLFKQIFEKFGFQYTQVDCKDLNQVEEAFKSHPTMIYIESPTNPLLEVYDLEAIAGLAKKYGAISCIDNTFASPYFQNPLLLGWDIVIHSTTKYIGGHSDYVGGAVITNNKEYRDQADFNRKAMGLHPDPFTMFLMRRSIKTLSIRMEKHHQNGMEIARYLEKHPKVSRVLYPGLESHPQHAIAKKQMRGFSGMLTAFFDMPIEKVKKMISSFEIITLAESLGAVESLVQLPATMSHQKIPDEIRRQHGLTDGLVRFSIGIEDSKDLIADFEQAFARC